MAVTPPAKGPGSLAKLAGVSAKRSCGLQAGESAGFNDWSVKWHAISFIYLFIYLSHPFLQCDYI